MGKPSSFKNGDLVFARVKGYPAWPARIKNFENGRHHVFFYGTYEEARLKPNEIFAFNEENEIKFVIPKNLKRKGYAEGMKELRETPEIVPGPSDIEDSEEDPVPSTPKPVSKAKQKQLTATLSHSAPAPSSSAPVVRKPMKLSDGTPVKRDSSSIATPSAKITAPSATPARSSSDAKRSRRSIQKPAEDSETEGSTPQQPVSSRSGRVIKQRRLSADDGSGDSASTALDQTKPRADLQIDDPRKIWVKKRNTGDMIEVQLDKEKPERWESHKQKLAWQQATAANAVKLKELVELGGFIPMELVESLKTKTDLTSEEKEQLKKVADQALKRQKVAWLLVEQELVDADIAIKTALSSQEPDLMECIRTLQLFLKLDLVKLMVVKQPHVLDTIRKVRRYEGPRDRDQLGDKEQERIKQNCQIIQTLADTLYNKLQAVFKFKPSKNLDFPEYLNQEVARLGEMTKGMKRMEVLALTQFPDSKPQRSSTKSS